MKHIVLYAALLATAVFVVGCASLGERPEQMIAEAKALDKQYVEAINKRDVDAAMATYWNSPDLVIYEVDSLEERGWHAVKDGTVERFANVPPGATYELTEANYKVAGDVVISWGKWCLRIPLPNGESSVLDGRWTGAVAKRDEKWVYILEHASVPF